MSSFTLPLLSGFDNTYTEPKKNFDSTSFSQNSFSPTLRYGENVNFGSVDASAKNVNLAKNVNIPWIEKYRPTQFSDIVLDPINRLFFNNILKKKYFPNLIFYGTPGTGKTTTIINLINEYHKNYYISLQSSRYLKKSSTLHFSPQATENVKSLFSNDPLIFAKGSVIHLNASDERGIDVIRSQINQFVKSKNIFNSCCKFVILDEVDHMTKNAQQALKYLIQTSNYNVHYCLICNYISKVDESLQQEFVCVRFNQLPRNEVFIFIKKVIDNENVKLNDKEIKTIQDIYKSDVRSIINFIQLNQNLTSSVDTSCNFSTLKNFSVKSLDENPIYKEQPNEVLYKTHFSSKTTKNEYSSMVRPEESLKATEKGYSKKSTFVCNLSKMENPLCVDPMDPSSLTFSPEISVDKNEFYENNVEEKLLSHNNPPYSPEFCPIVSQSEKIKDTEKNDYLLKWPSNIITNETWEILDLLLRNLTFLWEESPELKMNSFEQSVEESLKINKNKIIEFIYNVSNQYNMDIKNIIKTYFNYIIKNKMVTSKLLNLMETIIHSENTPNNVIVEYFVVFFKKYYQENLRDSS